MVFDWLHYRDLAKELLDTLPPQPAEYNDIDLAAIRCSISRAYYAAYWHSRRYVENRFYDFRISGESHTCVVRKMQDCPGELSSIGDQLDSLRLKRVKADYKLKGRFNRDDAASGILVADQIISRLDSLDK